VLRDVSSTVAMVLRRTISLIHHEAIHLWSDLVVMTAALSERQFSFPFCQPTPFYEALLIFSTREVGQRRNESIYVLILVELRYRGISFI
jgi:hypothetical protein